MAKDVVILVPGALGFDRFRDATYFAQRVVAALRMALEVMRGEPIIVRACTTLPASSLAERQAVLARELRRIWRAVEVDGHRPESLHLVGHSTGGLDAVLYSRLAGRALDREGNLTDSPHTDEDRRLREAHLRTVTTIASPLRGTALANSPTAGALLAPSPRNVGHLREFFGALLPVLRDDLVVSVFVNGLRGRGELANYLRNLAAYRHVIANVAPREIAKLELDRAPDPDGVVTRSFVALAPPPYTTPPVNGGDVTASDHARAQQLFDLLHRYCSAGEPLPPNAAIQANVQALRAEQRHAIQHRGLDPLPAIDALASDGMVNCARQMLAPGNLAGVVVADHLDVIGHYDYDVGCDTADGCETIKSGLLYSGSRFGDAEFTELYRAAAAGIAAHAGA